jgi:hypothetical protein
MSLRAALLLATSAVVLTSLAVGGAACAPLDPVTSAPSLTGPGTRALDSDDPTCTTTKDCATGEQCLEGLCQMQRCGTQAYTSAPPLGKRSYFAVDRELLVVNDDAARYALDGYEPTDGSFAHPPALSFSIDGGRVLDVTGGNLLGARPESSAAILDGSTRLYVVTGQDRREIELGFTPVATAAGDLQADGVDEVVVLGRDGDVAICSAQKASCERRAIPGILGKDVVVADVDGDGKAEPVVLGDRADGKSYLFVLNVDGQATGQPEVAELATGKTLTRLAAGDLDGQAPSELIALEDGGYLDFRADTLHFFGQQGGKLVETGTRSIADDAIDVHIGDVEGDGKAEVLVLEKSGLEVFVPQGPSDVSASYKTSLSASSKPSRLAMVDLDGDSPAGSLVGDRQLVPGPVVPLSVMVYPPYSRSHSDGTAQIGIGSTETKSDLAATTVSLRASLSVGLDTSIPGLVGSAIWASVDAQVARTAATGTSVTVGDRFLVNAKPELEGPDNGVAMLASACYHAYTYRIEDPAGRMGGKGGDGKLMSLLVPVGGQTSLWSLKRYNVLARRLKTLPVIEVPYVVGDPASYPTAMRKLDGKPIPTDDLLFAAPPAYRTSDVASVGWSLEVGSSTARTDALTVGISGGASVKLGPVFLEANVGGSAGAAYTVTVGRAATFSGTVPPVRNVAATPEDENKIYGYGFSPLVYRDRYKTADGKQGGYFVVTYSVAP